MRNLFTEYPIWRDALFQSLKFYVRNIIEVFQHLASDKEDLNAGFFAENPFEEVLRISGSGSDSHCENRVVYRVELDNGEVIYHKSRVNTGVRFFTNCMYGLAIPVGCLPI